jgi:4-amino-4-deoxy-L-arabinose transferase-like glycosyltransferase
MDTKKTKQVRAAMGRMFIIILLGVLCLGMFSHVMTTPVGPDEQMYITASTLVQKNVLYKDFAFAQMPYLPIFYGLLYKLTGISYYLLSGRLISFFFIVISIVLIYLLAYRLSKDRLFSLCALFLFALNRITLYIAGYSWNAVIPVALSLAGLYVFMRSVFETRAKQIGIFCSGFFLALAVGIKLYYAVILLPFFVVSLLYPASLRLKKRIIHVLLPLVSGIALGLLPALYYLIKDAYSFIFNNFSLHIAARNWYSITGYTESMDIISKIKYLIIVLCYYPTNTALCIGSFFIFFAIAKGIKAGNGQFLKQLLQRDSLLLTLMVFLTLVTVAFMKPLQFSYFALPFPFIIAMLACLFAAIPAKEKDRVRLIFIYLVALYFILSGGSLIKDSINLTDRNHWAGIYVHRVAENIRESIGPVPGGKIATLAPLYIVESGLPIYNELATGPFLYRFGDYIPEDTRKRIVLTSPQGLNELFKKETPRAILVGFWPKWESAFVRYAEENNYLKINKDFNGGTLYVRKDTY